MGCFQAALATILSVALLSACAMRPVIYSKDDAKISTAKSIYVEFQPDRLNLAELLRNHLNQYGFKTSRDKAQSSYLLTGTYHGFFDLFHDKIKHGRFTITDMSTDKEMLIVDVGDSSLYSADRQMDLVAEELSKFKD